MNETPVRIPLPERRGPPTVFTPPPPPVRRPPGPLKLGPNKYNSAADARTPIRFRFRTRVVDAIASFVDDLHPNVMRLHLQPSTTQRFLQALVRRLPSSIRAWFESFFPEWHLPSNIILKKHKPGWDEEFETEKAAYIRLQALQGVVIPKCFGEVRFENSRALLLCDIGDACLATPEGSLLEVPEFCRLLRQALAALAQFHIMQDDIKLDNFHLAGDRVMIVDLERLWEGPWTDAKITADIDATIKSLVRRYEDNQYCFWEDGYITIDN